ncbi:MAG: histidine triad nucleotide-binding protein [Spirochaetales bacterium]|nr:histidine triad nucleotide-binding protein [Spirochaetales bacterium]
MEDTIFDKILRGEIPSEKVYEDEVVYAFKDINPVAPVHVLVIPKSKLEKFSDFEDLSSLEVGNFIKKVSIVAKELGLKEDGYRVVFNNGRDGGQEVNYLHAHILGGKKLSFSRL